MKLITALAAPALLAVLGLAACDNYNQEQAKQPGSERGQQTGAVPPSSSTTTTPGSTSSSPGASGTTGSSGSSSGSTASPGTPPAEQQSR